MEAFYIFELFFIMMKRIRIFFILLSFGVLQNAQAQKVTVQEYIGMYAPLAITEMQQYKIPASITLAQGLLESGNGNSRLAIEAKNHFGIKCKKDWTGKTLHEDDDEKHECFRAYEKVEDSYNDHSKFLMQNARYAFLFDYDPTDYKSWAEGLKKAGYATNPQYPQLLIGLIERLELHKYDNANYVANDEKPKEEKPVAKVTDNSKASPKADPITDARNEVFKFNNIQAIKVQPNQSAASLAASLGMRSWQIYKYNDLEKGSDLIPGSIVYIKPKRRKGTEPYHKVKKGETMYEIAQAYGIKLDQLYKKNKMDEGTQPAENEIIYLRKKRAGTPALRDTASVKEIQIKEIKSPQPIQIKEEKPVVMTTPKYIEMIPDTAQLNKERRAQKLDSLLRKDNEELLQSDVKKKDAIVYEENSKNNEDHKVTITNKTPKTLQKAELDNVQFHIVSKGETLFSIAKKYAKSIEQIKALNSLENMNLSIGQKLIINENYKEEKPDVLVNNYFHIVSKGETVYSISKKYGISPAELIKLNNIQNNQLSIDQKLVIHTSPTAKENISAKTIDETYHTVIKGQTLYSISKLYNVSVEDIKKLNKEDLSTLSIGQKIRVK